jgi:hypothetical protein
VIDQNDLNNAPIIQFNLLKDIKNLYLEPFVSEEAEFDFGKILFDPQDYAKSIENISL